LRSRSSGALSIICFFISLFSISLPVIRLLSISLQ
jgi:hypothetical protein